ncbi:MAG: FtsW/RodA/SpoVE family cell cycle protein [Planctomycetes bacterium]|nr:FtsW/RodA/SpoVE family cell cycle protein [Planctomycetota bacterium]
MSHDPRVGRFSRYLRFVVRSNPISEVFPGLPLPFVSYGGSSLVVFWVMIGLLANIRRHWQEY